MALRFANGMSSRSGTATTSIMADHGLPRLSASNTAAVLRRNGALREWCESHVPAPGHDAMEAPNSFSSDASGREGEGIDAVRPLTRQEAQ